MEGLRIQDLRHFARTLFLKGIPEAIISKLTGHKSRELKRCEHLSPAVKKQTVDLITSELEVVSDSATGIPDKQWRQCR